MGCSLDAIKKANLLGIPLVVSPEDFENDRAKPYPLSIHAKANPVPYEYVNALAGLQSGPYTIDNALHIKPKIKQKKLDRGTKTPKLTR